MNPNSRTGRRNGSNISGYVGAPIQRRRYRLPDDKGIVLIPSTVLSPFLLHPASPSRSARGLSVSSYRLLLRPPLGEELGDPKTDKTASHQENDTEYDDDTGFLRRPVLLPLGEGAEGVASDNGGVVDGRHCGSLEDQNWRVFRLSR